MREMGERLECVIVGAGQAGLATSCELARAGVEHVVLDRGRVAGTWRGRWESFCLRRPNWSLRSRRAPTRAMTPTASCCATRSSAHLERYATRIEAPVREGVEVTSLRPHADGNSFALDTSEGRLEARTVVVASGAYQRAHRPAPRRPSGGAARSTWPAIGAPTCCPTARSWWWAAASRVRRSPKSSTTQGATCSSPAGARPGCRAGSAAETCYLVGGPTGFAAQPVEALPSAAARLEANLLATGRGGGHDLHLRTLQRMGVTLLGRSRVARAVGPASPAIWARASPGVTSATRDFMGLTGQAGGRARVARSRGSRARAVSPQTRPSSSTSAGSARWWWPAASGRTTNPGSFSRRLRRARLPAPGGRGEHGRVPASISLASTSCARASPRSWPAWARMPPWWPARSAPGSSNRQRPTARALRPTAGVSPVAAKRSSSATPGHPHDLAAHLDDRQRAPQRARDLAVGEEVLERLAAAEAERAHAVALAPAAHGGGVAERGGRHGHLARRSPRRASTSQSPKRARPGHRQLDRLRRLARLARAREAQRPVLGHRAQPAAEVERACVPPRRRARGSRPAPARSPASRRSTSRRTARAGARAAPRATTAGPPPSSSSAVVHRALEHLAPPRAAARGLGDRPLGRRADLAQRVQQVMAHARAREAAVGVRGVLAPVERRARAGSRAPPRGSRRAAAARAARAAAAMPCSAREPGRHGQPVEHGLRLVGGGVARPRSRPRRAARRARSARRAPRSWRLPLVAAARRARRAAAPRAARTARARSASSSSAPSRSP